MLSASLVAPVDESIMLFDVDAPTLALMADGLLQDRGTWSMKQWRNQCRFFAALASEAEQRALAAGRHWEASEVHAVAWCFAMQALKGWPLPTRLATEAVG